MKSFKQYLLAEADTSDATNTEMAICLAYNMKKLQEADPKIDLQVLFKEGADKAGIDTAKWNKIDSKKQKQLMSIGNAVVADTKLGSVGTWLIHSGSSSATNQYEKGSDKTPKTDLFGDSNNRFSLKKAGDSGTGAQLMSAKSGEASGVVRAAIAHYEKNSGTKMSEDKDFLKVFDIIENQMLAHSRNDLNVEVAKGKKDFQKWYLESSGRLKELSKKKLKDPKDKKGKKEYSDKKLLKHIKGELSALGAAPSKGGAKDIIDGQQISLADFQVYMDKYIKSSVAIGDVKVSPKWLENISAKELTKSNLKTQIVDIMKTSIESEGWKEHLQEFFANNQELKKWLVYEAASGLTKFTGKPSEGSKYTGSETAVANTMLVFHDTGIKTKEDVFPWSMSHPELAAKVTIDFKGTGRSKYPKLGIAAGMEYNGTLLTEEFDNTIEDIFETEYAIFQKECNEIFLSEGVFSDMKDKVVGKVKAAAKYLWENIIKKVIQKMKEWAAKGLELFLDILGYKMEGDVSMATPSW